MPQPYWSSSTDIPKPIDQVDGANDESDDGGQEVSPEESSRLQWNRHRSRTVHRATTEQSLVNQTDNALQDIGLTEAEELADSTTRKRKDFEDTQSTSRHLPRPRILRPRKTTMLDIAPAPLSPSELYSPKEHLFTEQHPTLEFVNDVALDDQLDIQVQATNTVPATALGNIPPAYVTVDDGSQPLSVSPNVAPVKKRQSQSSSTVETIPMDDNLHLSTEKRDHVEKETSIESNDIKGAQTIGKEASAPMSQTSHLSHPSVVTSETSEDGRPFTAKLNRMWSPKATEEATTAFRHHPPDVLSPTQSRSNTRIGQLDSLEIYDVESNTQQEMDGDITSSCTEVTYYQPPPILKREDPFNIVYQEPYYSDRRDVPKRPKIYAGKEFKLKSLDPSTLDVFSVAGHGVVDLNPKKTLSLDGKREHLESSTCMWTPSTIPPTFNDAVKWLVKENARLVDERRKAKDIEEGRRESVNNSADPSSTPVKKPKVYTQVM
jgi:hypothetical protein